MSKNEKSVSTEITTTSPDVPAVRYTELTQERVQELRRWREQIPRFAVPATADATKRLSGAASVPAEFIELTNLALANQPVLVRTEGLTPAESRDLVTYADATHPLADELEALAHFVRYSAMVARNTAGHEALTTYALAVRLAKRPATAYLAPYVADMRRALGRGRKPSPEVLAEKAAVRAIKAAARAGKKWPAAQPEPEPKPQE